MTFFRNCNAHISPLFRDSNTLKLPDEIALENCLFVNKYFNKFLPLTNVNLTKVFKNWFTISSDFHTSSTRWSSLGCLVVPPYNTTITILEELSQY